MAGRYITQNRMKRIKWEEAEVNSRNKRNYPNKKVIVEHWTCSCGSMQCMAYPGMKTARDKDWNVVPAVEVSQAHADRTLRNKKKRAKKITIKEYNLKRYGTLGQKV
jgi:hypothetical protein